MRTLFAGAIRRGLCALSLVAVIAGAAIAQSGAESTSTAAAEAARANPDPTAAPADYLAQVRANYTPENRAYSNTRVALDIVGIVYGIAVALLLLFSRVSARIRDFAHTRARNLYGRMLIYFTIYSLIAFVLGFPLAWYSGFVLEHQYHLSNQTFGGWFGDELKGLLIGILFTGITGILALAYWAIRRSPRRWWLWLAAGSIPVIVIMTLIQPLVIDPAFNRFEPLKDQQLKGQIIALAAKAGIPGRNVYQVDKSRQTKKYNAYVNGFGASQRIVLWDTTLEGMTTDEILFVMGHEMGHYRLGHIWKGIAFFSLLSVGLFFFSGTLVSWAVRRFGTRWGFHEIFDIASLPMFGIALSLVGLIAQPAINAYSRAIEHESDTFGLEVTHLNDAAARAFMKLGSQNKSNPEPSLVLEWFEYSHPPLLDRVRYALEYRPWETGQPNRAFKP